MLQEGGYAELYAPYCTLGIIELRIPEEGDR